MPNACDTVILEISSLLGIDILIIIIILLLKVVGSARLWVLYTLSVRRPQPPQYQPIDRKKWKGKIVQDYSGDQGV